MCTRSEPNKYTERANIRFMGTYGRPIKPHRTRVYESRAEFEYVNRNDAFTMRQLGLRESEGWHRKNPHVTAHVSQVGCSLLPLSPLPSPRPAAAPHSIRFSVVDMLPHLPATFFLSRFRRSNDRRIRLIGRLMPELGFPVSAYFMNRFLRAALRPPSCVHTCWHGQFLRGSFFNTTLIFVKLFLTYS